MFEMTVRRVKLRFQLLSLISRSRGFSTHNIRTVLTWQLQPWELFNDRPTFGIVFALAALSSADTGVSLVL